MTQPCPNEEDLHAYIEGWIDAEGAKAISAHLMECLHCQQLTTGWQAIGRSLRSLPVLPAPRRSPPIPAHAYLKGSHLFGLSMVCAFATAWLWLNIPYKPPLSHLMEWTPYPLLVQASQQVTENIDTLRQAVQEIPIWRR